MNLYGKAKFIKNTGEIQIYNKYINSKINHIKLNYQNFLYIYISNNFNKKDRNFQSYNEKVIRFKGEFEHINLKVNENIFSKIKTNILDGIKNKSLDEICKSFEIIDNNIKVEINDKSTNYINSKGIN